MNTDKFIALCVREIVKYYNERVDKTDKKELKPEDVFEVWNCKTLQNNKALLSTTVPDGMYYECTYNGDKKELYLDAYKKWENKKKIIVDEEEKPCYEAGDGSYDRAVEKCFK